MAFMLGSFTNGMFQGMDDTNKFIKGLYENRATKAMQDAAQKAGDAAGKNGQGGALPAVTAGKGNVGSSDPDSSLPGKINLDTDVPQPKHLMAKTTGPSAREHDNSAVNTSPTQAAQDMPGEQVPPATPPSAVQKMTSALTTPGSGPPMTPAQMYGGSSGPNMTPTQMYGNGGAVGQPGGAWATPQPRQAAPTYLSGHAPGSVQPPSPGAAPHPSAVGGGAGNTPTAQAAPLPGGPGTASPQMAAMQQSAPTLANGQSGLGAQLMASMNPQSGATA